MGASSGAKSLHKQTMQKHTPGSGKLFSGNVRTERNNFKIQNSGMIRLPAISRRKVIQ